jgi:hypothetical protein
MIKIETELLGLFTVGEFRYVKIKSGDILSMVKTKVSDFFIKSVTKKCL